MARRSIERTVTDFALSGVGIALIVLGLLIMLFREYPLRLLVLCILAFGGWQYWKRRQSMQRPSELQLSRQCTDQQIERHRGALIAYYRQSVRLDQFGNEDTRLWTKWIRTFMETQVTPELARLGIKADCDLHSYVDGRVRQIAQSDRCGDVREFGSDNVTPEQYEQSCATLLFRRGWTVRPTPTTGDHGADVVAEKGDVRLVIQCKLYSQPVGNKAVQEAYSACRLYDGTHACVVASNGYTAQAERAAHGLSVRLLHHSQLEAFADELSGSRPPHPRQASPSGLLER